MKKIDVCFLILHYRDQNLTVRAVESIKELKNIDNCKIVIVDNGSENGSGEFLKYKYSADPMIDIIISNENLGFSKGNNLGYEHIIANYETGFVIVMNNDILFSDNLFLDVLWKEYELEKFFLAGPDVYVPQRMWHSSPMKERIMTDEEFETYSKRFNTLYNEYEKNISLKTLKSYIFEELRDSFLLHLLYKCRRKLHGNPSEYRYKVNDCILQGACLILSELFIKTNAKIFTPETFLYEEENILVERCVRNGWKVVYLPDLKIEHTCQGSTLRKKQSFSNYKEKKKKELTYVRDSIKVYEQFRKQQKEKAYE